jgi:predicted transcriptional regulator
MKYSSIVLLFLLVVAVNVAAVQGGYSVEPYSPQIGPSDTLGADSTISFFELPLWVQLVWAISFFLAIFGAIKFGPLVFGKVKTILQNKNRTAVLEYIGNNPGCTLADLSKNTGINRGTAKYHLYVLLIARKIVRKKDRKLSYLFTNGGTHLERKRVYGYIMNPAKQEILTIILNRPGISNKEIAERLQLDRSTVYWHLQQFLEEKMVVSRWDGRNMNYFLFPEMEDILKEYRK